MSLQKQLSKRDLKAVKNPMIEDLNIIQEREEDSDSVEELLVNEDASTSANFSLKKSIEVSPAFSKNVTPAYKA